MEGTPGTVMSYSDSSVAVDDFNRAANLYHQGRPLTVVFALNNHSDVIRCALGLGRRGSSSRRREDGDCSVEVVGEVAPLTRLMEVLSQTRLQEGVEALLEEIDVQAGPALTSTPIKKEEGADGDAYDPMEWQPLEEDPVPMASQPMYYARLSSSPPQQQRTQNDFSPPEPSWPPLIKVTPSSGVSPPAPPADMSGLGRFLKRRMAERYADPRILDAVARSVRLDNQCSIVALGSIFNFHHKVFLQMLRIKSI